MVLKMSFRGDGDSDGGGVDDGSFVRAIKHSNVDWNIKSESIDSQNAAVQHLYTCELSPFYMTRTYYQIKNPAQAVVG